MHMFNINDKIHTILCIPIYLVPENHNAHHSFQIESAVQKSAALKNKTKKTCIHLSYNSAWYRSTLLKIINLTLVAQ